MNNIEEMTKRSYERMEMLRKEVACLQCDMEKLKCEMKSAEDRKRYLSLALNDTMCKLACIRESLACTEKELEELQKQS